MLQYVQLDIQRYVRCGLWPFILAIKKFSSNTEYHATQNIIIPVSNRKLPNNPVYKGAYTKRFVNSIRFVVMICIIYSSKLPKTQFLTFYAPIQLLLVVFIQCFLCKQMGKNDNILWIEESRQIQKRRNPTSKC